MTTVLGALGLAGAAGADEGDAPAPFELRIVVDPDRPERAVVEVVIHEKRLAEEISMAMTGPLDASVLRLALDGAPDDACLLGRHEVDRAARVLRFHAGVDLVAGNRYRAIFDPAALGLPEPPAGARRLVAHHRRPGSRVPAPGIRVVAIHPTAPVLPANQLRFYLHFSGSMAGGDVLEHVRLIGIDDEGRETADPEAFYRTELWNEDRTRLTLLFHPGRQKSGFEMGERLGRIVEPGRRYRIEVSASMRDARGAPLAAGFEHPFAIGAEERRQVDPRRWRIEPGAAGTRVPLVVRFDRPMDHALLARFLEVATDDAGQRIAGAIESFEHDRAWRFTPDAPWIDAGHRIVVDPRLEDTCGNNLRRPFEVDVTAPRPEPAPSVVEFRPAR